MTTATRPRPAWLEKPVLPGDLVTLRPFARSDAHAMAALLADPELLRLTGSVDSTAAALARSAAADPELLEWYGSR